MSEPILRAPAQLTAQTRGAFRDEALQALECLGAASGAMLIVDLSETRRIDSTGLGVLVAVQARAAERKMQICLRGASEEVRLLLLLTRLEDRFVIENGVAH